MTKTPPPPAILILAAGAASRMRGEDKLLQPVGGQLLLARIAGQALATGLPVLVVLPPDRPARLAALQPTGAQHVIAEEAGLGMAHSLAAGVAALPADRAVMLLLADLPEITTADLLRVADHHRAAPASILRGAGADGTPGHPVLFPPGFRAELLALRGDEGARSLLQRHRALVQLVPLPGQHATTDLDTPEAWAAWRAANP
jgi:molybdenum cofactor cytidylyltransferase